jgi:hypothetical protein
MKELMCTHLSKRGNTYYYRRKTPTDLVHIFGNEVMKSLGTKERKLAEILVRQMGSHYDGLFANALASDLERAETPIASQSPPIVAIKPPAFDVGLGLALASLL